MRWPSCRRCRADKRPGMSDADDATARDLEQAARRTLDHPHRPANDGGPPTMPTEVVRQPSLRPDPRLPDPLSGRGPQAPGRPRQTHGTPPPASPQRQPQPQPSPQSLSRPGPQPGSHAEQRPQPQRPPQPEQRPPQPEQRHQPQRPHPSNVPPPLQQQQPRNQPQRPLPQQRPEPEVQAGGTRRHDEDTPQRREIRQPPFAYQPDPARGTERGTARSAPPRPQQKQKPRSKGRRKRDAKEVQGNRAREAKWAANRWAVPYFTDGPKVTLGVLWFALLMGGALLGFNYDNSTVSSVAVAVVTATVAALAGLQIGFAWFPKNSATRTWTATAAFVLGISGFYGPWGVLVGLIIGLLVLTAYLILYRGHRRSSAQLFDILARAAVPVGLASASLGAMAYRNLPVLIALVLFVSAYEVGDFLVGSGAFNPVEGPLAGIIAAGVVAFFLFLIQPDPFSSETILMFVAVGAVCCVAGQYLASALLPRGSIWAPALRRLDSYLLVAPLWLLLLVLLPDIH